MARYNGPGNDRDGTALFIGFFTSHPIAVDELGKVYVTGLSTGSTAGFDLTTIKYGQPALACGDKGEKVLLCHKGVETICVKRSAVSDHLNHGDQYGACVVPVTITARQNQLASSPAVLPTRFGVSVIPNPTATTTKIFYELPVEGRVSIKLFDLAGREIKTLVDATKLAGFHNAEFNVATLQKGMYVYRITVRSANTNWSETGKLSVLK